MFPMIVALLIGIAAGGSGAYAGDTSYLPETRQAQGIARQMAHEEAPDRAPEPAKAAWQPAGEAGHGDPAAAPAVPSLDAIAGDSVLARRSLAISSTTGVTLTQTISDVLKLADDPLTAGQSYHGLLAKLEAVDKALDRGQARVAVHVLDAFHNQLNALQHSGHITARNYDDLLSRYAALVASLGATPKEGTEPHHPPAPGAGAATAADPGERDKDHKAGRPDAGPPVAKGPKRR